MYDLTDIKAFVTVAKLGSFTAAAAEMHMSQPALSRRIEKLETALNTRLLKRTTRKVDLTPVGMEFNRRATELLHNFDEALLGIGDAAKNFSGEVNFSCMPSASRFFLPPILCAYHQRFPGITVRVIDQGATDAIAAVKRREADFAFNHLDTQDPELTSTLILQERLVLACPPSHPLAHRPSVKWAELCAYDYMSVTKASSNRLLIDMALATLPDKPRAFCEAQHVSTLVSFVEAGLGIAAVPNMCMPVAKHPNLVSVPLTHPVVSRKVGLISRRGSRLSLAAQKLYDDLLQLKHTLG